MKIKIGIAKSDKCSGRSKLVDIPIDDYQDLGYLNPPLNVMAID
jgi:hypothetical protein